MSAITLQAFSFIEIPEFNRLSSVDDKMYLPLGENLPKETGRLSAFAIFLIHLINQVPCVSSCWGGEDTHPWSATKVGNPIPATITVDQQQ